MALTGFEQILYVDILKITLANMPVTMIADVQSRLLYLLAIPSFIVALFLASVMKWIANEHKGLSIVGGVIVYLFLILGGWYGTMLVPIFSQYFIVWVGAMLVFFFISRVVSPAYIPGLAKLGTAVVGKVGEATVGKAKDRKKAEKELEVIEKTIQQLETRYGGDARTMPWGASDMYAQLMLKREHLRRQLGD